MTRSELEALKEKAKAQRVKSQDLDEVLNKLGQLHEALQPLIPEPVKAILRKYGWMK